jgi:hypothetical protein
MTGILFERPFKSIKYTMLKHEGRYKNPNRIKLLNEATQRKDIDGLNTVKYDLYGILKYPLFTHMIINVGDP